MKTVEWRDETGPHKVTLPDRCDDVALGVHYGVPWEYIARGITPEQVAAAMRDNGIWTAQDLRTNVKLARAALYGLVGAVLSALLEHTREVQ